MHNKHLQHTGESHFTKEPHGLNQVNPSLQPLKNPLLEAFWRSPDRIHQISEMDRDTGRFKNLHAKDVSTAIARALAISEVGKDVYFACAEYLSANSRMAGNASGAWGFWMDIDCGENKAAAGKGYLTEEKALIAVNKFCADTVLPYPTHIVSSGGGLHIYWVLDNVAESEMWLAYARRLKAITKALKFLVDDSRTADIASVLRIPGTLNFKYDPPKLVTLIHASNKHIEQKGMFHAIDSAFKLLCGGMDSHSAQFVFKTVNADHTQYGPPDLKKLTSAMSILDPDCNDETWKLRRLAPLAGAARAYPDFSEALYIIAKSWSSGKLRGIESKAWVNPGSNGYTGEEVFDTVWQRFLNYNYGGIPVTLGTIYFDAKEAGWDKSIDSAGQFEIINKEIGENA
ncbi:hypothetical protein [Sulfurirhabdus autotrophica]|uniref:Uncharacterized protein n=1 Tax=Sulfurirhabdus autotrophica TaxID=1706046 RepID=A0A4R3Y4M5_9PROT|nr:hypothetical protein [Sulfurirhabdus autotrophica]TCV86657.1 hypothetical protein EDC63_10618 [Sulfurirhabdus autotrophica]